MADAETKKNANLAQTGGEKPQKSSKTKQAKGRKTKTVKQKLVKTNAADAQTTVATEATVVDKVVTARKKRIAEKVTTRVKVEMPEIEPVYAMKITELDATEYDSTEYDELMEMYVGTIQDIKEGEIVNGTVIGVTREDIIVDVGFKSEGIIPIGEFTGNVNIAIGDEIEVFLEAVEDQNGQMILSKQKADFMRVWDNIRISHDAGELVQGRIKRRIKGGVVVDVMGVDAFLPGSQIALRQVPDFDALIGQMLDVKIIKLNKSRRNIVVSRRVVLEEQREQMRSKLLEEIELGQEREGVVKNITDFGVFIDLGGVDGLLHITDMSWGRMRHPSEMVQLSDNLTVKILDFDEKTSRISLGLKQLTPYPWENIEEKYPLNKRIKGRVVSITDYGAFVELEKGIEGLIHISEMSWTQHIKHPSKIMSLGDTVEAVVLSVDKENEKISLGIKQMEPDPWTMVHSKYPVNSVVKGKVRNLTAFGAFVEIEEGIDGLVHISDMSWTKRVQHPSEIMKKGESIKIKVLRIDSENRRVSLGFKQLKDDPWPEYAKKFGVGNEVLGTVLRQMDRGLVVELDGEVEGFIPANQLGKEKMDKPAEAFNENDKIPLKVIEFDRPGRKIVLSVTAYFEKRDRDEYEKFLADHPTKSVSIGEAIGEEAEGETPATEEAPLAEAPVEAAPIEDAPVEESAEAPATEEPKAEEPVAEAKVAEETPVEESASTETPSEETPAEEDSSSDEEKPKE
ncbi:MAG: 30S ribosomal protein S1 [FCB group bacterium]|nr:30S ribosomal protein S1 [FCB group bacterium]